MKILMTVIMTLILTSAFAGECTLKGDCKSDVDCKALNAEYSLIGGKCINPAASQVETKCPSIVTSAGAKATGSDAAPTAGVKATENAGK